MMYEKGHKRNIFKDENLAIITTYNACDSKLA